MFKTVLAAFLPVLIFIVSVQLDRIGGTKQREDCQQERRNIHSFHPEINF